MLRGIVTRGLLLGVLAAPLGAVISAPSAAALTCAPGDIVVVKTKATPTTVPSGSDVSVVTTAINCTAETQVVTVVSKRFSPDPCGNASNTDSFTFAAPRVHQEDLDVPTRALPGPLAVHVGALARFDSPQQVVG